LIYFYTFSFFQLSVLLLLPRRPLEAKAAAATAAAAAAAAATTVSVAFPLRSLLGGTALPRVRDVTWEKEREKSLNKGRAADAKNERERVQRKNSRGGSLAPIFSPLSSHSDSLSLTKAAAARSRL
jgi:hypothetical protein